MDWVFMILKSFLWFILFLTFIATSSDSEKFCLWIYNSSEANETNRVSKVILEVSLTKAALGVSLAALESTLDKVTLENPLAVLAKVTLAWKFPCQAKVPLDLEVSLAKVVLENSLAKVTLEVLHQPLWRQKPVSL